MVRATETAPILPCISDVAFSTHLKIHRRLYTRRRLHRADLPPSPCINNARAIRVKTARQRGSGYFSSRPSEINAARYRLIRKSRRPSILKSQAAHLFRANLERRADCFDKNPAIYRPGGRILVNVKIAKACNDTPLLLQPFYHARRPFFSMYHQERAESCCRSSTCGSKGDAKVGQQPA